MSSDFEMIMRIYFRVHPDEQATDQPALECKHDDDDDDDDR
jgi:hypothetical protein